MFGRNGGEGELRRHAHEWKFAIIRFAAGRGACIHLRSRGFSEAGWILGAIWSFKGLGKL